MATHSELIRLMSEICKWLAGGYGPLPAGVSLLIKPAEFETAVRLGPDSVDARSDLGEFYLEAPGIVGGGRDKAEAQAKTLSTLDPAKAHWPNGRIAEKRKDLITAEKEYRAAIDARG